MVSIIMPAYNASKTIRESINSVLDQTFKDWELLIINDCSTDNTKEIVSKFLTDARIKYFENKENLKVAETRNKGLKEAKYDYIAFLDSDDLWLPNKLQVQISFMEENDISFSVSDYEIINNEGLETKKYIKSKNQNYKSMLRGNNVGCLTAVINKKKINDFKFKNVGHEDYVLWLEILKSNNIEVYSINQILAKHRRTEGSLSSNKRKTVKWVWNIYRKVENKNFIMSIYLMFRYIVNVFIKTKRR